MGSKIFIFVLVVITFLQISCSPEKHYKEQNGRWVLNEFPHLSFKPLDHTWEPLFPPTNNCPLFYSKKGGNSQIGVFLHSGPHPWELMQIYLSNDNKGKKGKKVLLQPILPYRQGYVATCVNYIDLEKGIFSIEEYVTSITRESMAIGFTIKRRFRDNNRLKLFGVNSLFLNPSVASDFNDFHDFVKNCNDLTYPSSNPGTRISFTDHPYSILAPPQGWKENFPPSPVSIYPTDNYVTRYTNYHGSTISVYIYNNSNTSSNGTQGAYADIIKLLLSDTKNFYKQRQCPPKLNYAISNDITADVYATFAQGINWDIKETEITAFVKKSNHLIAFIYRKKSIPNYHYKDASEFFNQENQEMKIFKEVIGSLREN